MIMKVEIDQQKCNGAGVCVQELPEIFRFQEGSKKGIEKTRGVPPGLEQKVLRAAKQCPSSAIIVLDK
jgi:ferredoxin